MATTRELSFDECVRLLGAGLMGRVALNTPGGPRIVPVNYAVVDESVLVATSPVSALGTYGPRNLVAFEVDHADYESHTGWSVVVQGRAEVVTDPDEVRRLRRVWAPRPWAGGDRDLHLRVPWTEVSGRTVGDNLWTPVQRVVHAS